MAEHGHYSIGKLAHMAHVSVRTLRLYEEEGLVVPARAANGYRSYTETDARRLAQVLSMRECGLSLATIRELLGTGSGQDVSHALTSHLAHLEDRRAELEDAIRHTRAALARVERMQDMSASQAFEDMKRRAVEDNKEAYGKEARARYGEQAVEDANARMLGMTEPQWAEKERLEQAVLEQLRAAREEGDPRGVAAQELVRLHRRWIALHWGADPSPEAYAGLARGYLADERFVRYYDSAAGQGATQFLAQGMEALAG